MDERRMGVQTPPRLTSLLYGRPPWLAALLAFVVGLLCGWLLIGWWLWPVQWIDARPADLAPTERAAYIQMVADLYQREALLPQRHDRAKERLRSFESDQISRTLAMLLDPRRDPVAVEHARQLAIDFDFLPRQAVGPDDAATADADVGPLALSQDGTVLAALRWLAIGVLIAGGVAALALAWAWTRWRNRPDDKDHGNHPALEPATSQLPSAATEALEWGDELLTDGESAVTTAGWSADPRQPSATDRAGDELGRVRVSRRDAAAGAPSWRPARIDLSQSTHAEFDGADDRYFQTWLVYDERGGLVGSAGMKAQPLGSLNTLDVWFFERDEEGEPRARPTVTIISCAAMEDPVLRARLSDRLLLAATPGESTALLTSELALLVEVEQVQPPPGEDLLALQTLRLRLTPVRRDSLPLEDDGQDPPSPLPYHREQ